MLESFFHKVAALLLIPKKTSESLSSSKGRLTNQKLCSNVDPTFGGRGGVLLRRLDFTSKIIKFQ